MRQRRSFNFHNMNETRRVNLIRIYRNGKKTEEIKLFRLPTPEKFLFIMLPLIAGLILLQTLWYVVRLAKKEGKFDFYLTVNAFTAWVGNLLRTLGCVDKTVFWVWDYYPPGYPDWQIRLARWGYWRVDKLATWFSNTTLFLNEKLVTLRQEIGVLPQNHPHTIVPIGTNPHSLSRPPSAQIIIGHLGVLKRSQGLDLLFDTLPILLKKFPRLKIEIVGAGPDESYFKTRAQLFRNVTFYGFIKQENTVDAIIRQWKMGLATYFPDSGNPAYWTDPSKIKAYISQGVPVITTAITPFSEEVRRYHAGVVVDYFDQSQFVEAVSKILKRPDFFRASAYHLAQLYFSSLSAQKL